MPESNGETFLQEKYNTKKKAVVFYENQMLDFINQPMMEFILQQEMMFISTSDSKGNCDCSFRSGGKGFVRVIDQKTLLYPEFQGNGVFASLGNILENPHIGLLFIDFFQNGIGLHINGQAKIIETFELPLLVPDSIYEEINQTLMNKAARWVAIEVEEAYIHCSKHIPTLQKVNQTDEIKKTSGDFFKVKLGKNLISPS
jgi:uncharacterized protein